MAITTELRSKRDQIDSFLARASAETDDYKRSIFAKWLIMRTAGYVEAGFQEIIGDYVRRRSNHQIADFASRQIEKYLSINMEKADEILRSFSPTWPTALKDKLTPAQSEAVNSVKNLRDLFAHGKENGVGWTTATQYWGSVKEFIDKLSEVVS